VDTGAQANLINEELIPKICMSWATEQLHLVAANGLTIPGGNYEVHARMSLQRVTARGELLGVQHLEASLHVAQLSLDAILSYPWLAKHGLLVGAQQNSLMLAHPEQLFLRPLEKLSMANTMSTPNRAVHTVEQSACVVPGHSGGSSWVTVQGREYNCGSNCTSGLGTPETEGRSVPEPWVSGISPNPRLTPHGRDCNPYPPHQFANPTKLSRFLDGCVRVTRRVQTRVHGRCQK
jgi:hypothetical protein